MIIREFTSTDIDEITGLMKNLCTIKKQKFDEERWRASLSSQMKRDSESQVIVALDKETNQVLGMANCSVRTTDEGLRFGYISNLIVVEEERRKGIGENLMKNMIDFFRRHHIESIRLALKSTLEDGPKILFKKLGFQEMIRIYQLNI